MIAFDLVMSEYGVSSLHAIWEWTPAQILVMAEQIQRRRAVRMAEELELQYLAVGAAMAGRKGASALKGAARRLRAAGGVKSGQRLEPEQLAAALGLTLKRPPGED